MKRLFHKVYLTIILSLVMVIVVAGAIRLAGWEVSPSGSIFEIAGELLAADLPPADAPRPAQQQAIAHLAERLGIDVALYDANALLIARAGGALPPPNRNRGGLVVGPGGPAWSFRLSGGRVLVARTAAQPRHPALRLMLVLGCISLVVAVCAYPVVRSLTGRLERLQAGVETLGAGDLSARVKVEGRDEVARLATSFNRAAARIEELVHAHRMLLSNASHDLRTPLSRLRLGIELYKETGDPKYKAELDRDIAELDLLIDEILLASRLDATRALPSREEVDLLALVAEECARYGYIPEGLPVIVEGDPRLLRRLVRNLLDNARRHGRPPVRVEVRPEDGMAVLRVVDSGQGIPQAERERIFLPFHRLSTDPNGTGLGLALVRQIARLHGGDAVVAPQADPPSCFRITIPRFQAGLGER
jgi:two-component system, OmpR family, sensor histidine kinase RstB